MKKLILIAALGSFGWGSVALADGPVSSGSASQQQQQQAANAAASNQGNAQSISFTTPANTTSVVTQGVTENVTSSSTTNGTQTVKEQVSGGTREDETLRNVPNVSAPAITTSNDTCMGSTSAGAAFVGTGLTFGTTWTDKNCLMLKNSRELWNMGMRAAAMARMCMDKNNREALELTGFVCPQDEKKQSK